MAKNLRSFLHAALILLAGFWVFSPALHGDWLWDDYEDITLNPMLVGLSGLRKIWLAPVSVNYFPLKTTVQWVQWQLWQDHPFGYHLTNVGLHLLSALLLWHLLKKFGVRPAWLGGLLFAVHPLAVESVAWITELKNTLALPPLLLAMSAYVDYDEHHRRADYLRSVLLFLAAMLSKTLVAMFPVILLLYCWWKRGRVTRADLKAGAVFFAISLALGVVTILFEHQRAIGHETVFVGGFFPRLAGAGLALGFYFFKSIFPAGLLPMYPRWAVESPSPVQFLPWLLLGAAFYGLWRRRAAWGRHVLFGAGCFVLNLAPVLGFIKISYLYISWVADHFAYFSLVSLTGLAAAGAGLVAERLSAPLRPYACGAAAMILALLTFQSHRYAEFFRNSEALWTYAVQRNPKAWVAYKDLGDTLVQAGRLPEAVKQFEKALLLKPDDAGNQNNLGIALARTGRVAEAIGHYEKALRLKPDYAEAHGNLGLAMFEKGRVAEAIGHYEAALRIKPGSAEINHFLGLALVQAGRVPEAIGRYEEALRVEPGSAEMHDNLGLALVRAGRVTEAVGHYQKALQIKPDFAEAHYNLGNALLSLDRGAEAIGHYREALRFKPAYAEAHNNLGSALVQAGRVTEAIGHYEEALRLKPDYAAARDNLARLQALHQTPGPGK